MGRPCLWKRKNEFKWSAGRPRPAVSDLDGRDARRSIM